MNSNSELRVFTGNAHPTLHSGICEYLKIDIGDVKVTQFHNENIFVKFQESIRNLDVFLLQPFASPVNQNIMELLIMADAARRASAGRITAVIPFYAYGRTDMKYEPRVPITARLIANLITTAGVDRVLTVDLHAGQISGFFDIPVDEISALPLIQQYFIQDAEDHVVVAPHEGSSQRARVLSARLGLPLAVFYKNEIDVADHAENLSILGDVTGKSTILIENEVDTGSSLANAAQRLIELGAVRVSAVAIHPVFSAPAVKRLQESPIDELLVTDTLPVHSECAARLPIKVLTVAHLLGEAIRRIHVGCSVVELSSC